MIAEKYTQFFFSSFKLSIHSIAACNSGPCSCSYSSPEQIWGAPTSSCAWQQLAAVQGQ